MEITSKLEYYAAMAQIETFLKKGFDDLTQAEEDELDILSKAAEAWELNAYPMPVKPALKDILNFIMYQKKLNQTELSHVLKISKSSLSEILNGKKKPNIGMAKQLHAEFQIDGNLILESI
jgi:HTH-type transcriptional regulator/antitoxin HigA